MAETFTVQIQKWVDKTKDNLDQFVREFNQDLAEAVQENTPVKTGFLRASWTASISVPDLAFKGSQNPDSSRVMLILKDVKAGDIVYHTNNTSYGEFVEFGTSKMEARAFVRQTVAQADQIAADVAARINK